MYVESIPEHDVTLVELTPTEARELLAVLNSSDLLRARVYDRVPLIKGLVDNLYNADDFQVGRARLNEMYGIGVKDAGGIINFKIDPEDLEEK